jgi:photosystem II stability/assembly factor-like uncharacterized protein
MKKLIFLISFLIISNIIFCQDEWTMIHPYPTLDDLLDTHFITEDEGWAVGKNGLIMYTNDGGVTWDIQHKHSEKLFWSVFFIDENEGWTVGWRDIYHTTDRGDTWERQNRPSVIGDLIDVFFINPDTGWIVGTYKIILKTVDGGNNWTKIMNSSSGFAGFRSVCFSDDMNGCVVGGETTFHDGIIKVTNDGGITWTDTSPPGYDGFRRVLMIDSITAWACGYGSEILKTIDGGLTWTDKDNSYHGSYSDIHFFNENDGILLNSSSVRLTFNGGETWDSIIYMGASSSQNRFASWTENEILSVGDNGSICISQDGGNNWSNVNSGMTQKINQVGFFNSIDGYAIAGYNGNEDLIKTNDGGYNWHFDTLIDNGPFYRMMIRDESFYLLNRSSKMMKSNNEGDDWELLSIPDTTDYYYDIQFIDNNTGFLCGNDGIFVKTEDGGNTWIDKSLSGDYNLRQMFFHNDQLGWLIDPVARIVLRTINGGDEWLFTILGEDYTYQPQSIFFVNENTGFVTTKEGVVFSTLNGGETWFEFYIFASGTDSKIYFINETEGWYKSSSSIYHTYDGGVSWTSPENFSYTHLSGMFFLDNQGWLFGYNGLIAKSSFFVGVDEYSENKEETASVFPNPTTNELKVELSNAKEKILNARIYNMEGHCVINYNSLKEENSIILNISNLESGIYIIHVSTGNTKYAMKFMVV